MGSAGLEVRNINRRRVFAAQAGKLSNQIPFQPALKGTEEQIDPDSPGDDEDNLGNGHTLVLSEGVVRIAV